MAGSFIPLSAVTRLLDRVTQPRVLVIWFLLCLLPTGLGLALLTPTGGVSDEPAHLGRADGLLHGEISGRHPPPNLVNFPVSAGVAVDNGILWLLYSTETKDAEHNAPVPAEARRAASALRWLPGTTYYPTQMVAYFPIMYVPSALGLAAGRAGGLSPAQSFYLGRIAQLLAFLALGAAAIGLARGGNVLLFALLTLPTTITLGASFNEDGMIIAACALAAALLSRWGPGAEAGTGWIRGMVLAVLAAVGSAKTPYAALLLVGVAPLVAPGLWRRAALVLLAAVPPALWLLHTMRFGFMRYVTYPYHPGPLWPGARDVVWNHVSPAKNLHVLLTHPLQIIVLPVVSFVNDWPNAWPQFLAGVSWGTMLIYPWEYPCLAAALLAAAAATAYSPAGMWRWPDTGLVALAVFGAFIGVELSLYLTWTDVGLDIVRGVNARYFLPLAPFLIVLLPTAGRWLGRLPGAKWGRAAAPWLALPAMALAAVNVAALPMFIYHAYHVARP